MAVSAITGCGGSSTTNTGGQTGPIAGQTTPVTLLLTSNATDFLMGFQLQLATLTLTDQSGNTVNVLTAPQTVEAIHAQASPSPLVTVNIPQGVYTSAQFTDNGATFEYLTYVQQQFSDATNNTLGDCCQSAPTITLNGPVTIDGTGMQMLLSLDASKSIVPTGLSYIEAANLTLSANAIPSPTVSGQTPQVQDLYGQVMSLSSDGFEMKTTDGATLSITVGGSTSFSGVTSLADLSSGEFLVVDGSLAADGTLSATRLQVADATSPNMIIGPVTSPPESSEFFLALTHGMGSDPYVQEPDSSPFLYNASTSFKISSRFTNLSSLPFAATFSPSTMVPGQNIWASVPGVNVNNGIPVATTLMLVPQTINGLVLSSSTSGSFTVYSVQLYANDYISVATSGINASNTFSSPMFINVYVDNQSPTSIGSVGNGVVAHFNGLIFDNGGTLNMDCGQIFAGTPE